MNLSLQQIADATGGILRGNPDVCIKDFHIDSRKYISPESSVFCALKGERNDGHDYIPALVKKGIHSYIVEEIPVLDEENLNFIQVENCLEAMQTLASYVRKNYGGRVLGITGSNGKTIVKEWIHQALACEIRIFRSPESYNSQVGVPLSLFLLEQESEMAVLEAGISKPGEMTSLWKMIKPDIGILTNIGEAHQENFTSKLEKLEEKLNLFKGVEKLIYCADNQMVRAAVKNLQKESLVVSWGREERADYLFRQRQEKDRIYLSVTGKIKAGFYLGFRDQASIENASHLIVFLLEEGFSLEWIQDVLNRLEPVGMRMEIISGSGNTTIINDSYNSDLVSLENAMDYLAVQDQHSKKTVILSDILQSGKSPQEILGSIKTMMEKRKPDRFIGIGPDFYNQRNFLPQDWRVYSGTADFIREFKSYNFTNEAILLKGGRKFGFERISSLLQEKTHRTTLEINLNALVENYRFYKSLLDHGTKVMAMVKAFSYGSGGYEAASVLQYNKVDYLAVAYADEGVALRQKGIHLPIMVMNPEVSDFHSIIKYKLEPEIYSFRILREFKSFLKRNPQEIWPIHIKLDTGMHRLGFERSEIDMLIPELGDGYIRVASVFSHLAAADDPLQDDFTVFQLRSFNEMADHISNHTNYSFLKHILNTPGVERFPKYSFDMVRLGIGLYGISEKYRNQLTEVSTFKTSISQIRNLKPSETVGYGRRGKLAFPTRIATLPVGYADGIPRSLGNGKGRFMIGNKMVPVIGNICMDMTMVDLGRINAKEGDEVIIFGEQYSVRNMAESLETISYEVLTGISQRVKRVYYIK